LDKFKESFTRIILCEYILKLEIVFVEIPQFRLVWTLLKQKLSS
jgi:hypothetical protein